MITLLVCLTMLQSVGVDLAATETMVGRYGLAAEGNPIVRALGPEVTVFPVLLATAGTCRQDDPGWTTAAVVLWVAEVFAVDTHVRAGTASAGVPLLFFTWSP
ncbi:MAG: hypothetical protein AUI52_05460 [Acidobacteria bacterium 13_1_40CM_2_68_10]|nr:MAG: hypothetical protein AUI52_05460 [Acidobacteria bacterium 13_1_40CM_2_68_10]